jgi:hypothetical protein
MIHQRTGGRREYEKQLLAAVRRERVVCMFWARRCRKSTNLGAIAFDEMSKAPGSTVIAASASLLLGTELVNMTVSAVESAIALASESAAVRTEMESGAAGAALDLQYFEKAKPDEVSAGGTRRLDLSPDAFAELYAARRLEMRLYFDRTAYSRQLIIAPVPATARGWRGTVLRDEAGFTAVNLELALREAVDPIFRDVPDLKMIYASNLCRDDRHPFFTMTMPPPDMDFPADAKGHFYRGENRILIHRVALADAYAAGHVLYDNRGAPMTIEEFRSEPGNKGQLPYNYDLLHISGGTAAIDLLAMLTAQQRGIGRCHCAFIDDDADFQRALHALSANLRAGRVSIGMDPATTTKATSNPTCVTITELNGGERAQRLVLFWKERKARIVIDRLKSLCTRIAQRPQGGPAVSFNILATNERYFADLVADDLRALVPVHLIIESQNVEPQPAGYQDTINFKTFLGDLYSAAVNENRYALPGGEYFKKDQRMTVKNGGRYECTPDSSDGAHGDSFASGGAAEYGLHGTHAAVSSSVAIRGNERSRGGMSRNIGGML